MIRLYSEVAYASGAISRESAESLREIWTLMRANPPAMSQSVVAS